MQTNLSYQNTMQDENVCVEPKYFYTASEVARMLYVSRSTAYREIRKLNSELEKKGFVTVSGKIPVKFFHERFYCI